MGGTKTHGTVLGDDDLPKLITGEDIEPGYAIDLDNDGKPYGEPRTVAEVRELHEGRLFYVEFSDEQPGASFAFDEGVWLVFRPDVQGMAEAAEERMHDDLDALLRREVDAALGHGNWTGDVDPPLVAAFHLHLVGVLRQLIQNGVPAGVKPAAEPEPKARKRHVAEDPDLPGIDMEPLRHYEIMQSVIAVVLNREETTPQEINAYLAEEGAETLYEAHIAPAITTVEQAIRGDLEPVGPEDEST